MIVLLACYEYYCVSLLYNTIQLAVYNIGNIICAYMHYTQLCGATYKQYTYNIQYECMYVCILCLLSHQFTLNVLEVPV